MSCRFFQKGQSADFLPWSLLGNKWIQQQHRSYLSMKRRSGFLSRRLGYSCWVVSMASPILPDNTSFWISASQQSTCSQADNSLTVFIQRWCWTGLPALPPVSATTLYYSEVLKQDDSLWRFLMEASSSCTAWSVDLAKASAVAQ